MRFLLLACLAAALPAGLAAQDAGADPASPPARLFEADDPIRIRIDADFRAVFRDRDTNTTTWHPARLAWVAPGDSGGMDIEIATRGHFRLQASNCAFPPIRVRFDREARRGTIWRGQGTLKLGTHCRSGNRRHEQIVHQEYLVYRTYNVVTDTSFRVRFAHATYIDTRDTTRVVEAPAFFIEDIDDLAERIGGTRLEQTGVTFDVAEPLPTALMSMFLYMVGGSDWSLPFEHNIRVVATEDRRYIPVAYDFDWTGIVNAPYARPAPILNIRTVQERVWRGPCVEPGPFAAGLERMEAAREAILQLWETHEGLEDRYRRGGVSYLNEFFKEITDLRRRRPTLEGVCRLGGT